MAFPKGRPNPGAGRKPGVNGKLAEELGVFARQMIFDEKEPIIKALIKQAKAGDMKAISECLNRVMGKPVEMVEHKGEVQLLIDL
jgi:predicted amidophosphoribosyltransferase